MKNKIKNIAIATAIAAGGGYAANDQYQLRAEREFVVAVDHRAKIPGKIEDFVEGRKLRRKVGKRRKGQERVLLSRKKAKEIAVPSGIILEEVFEGYAIPESSCAPDPVPPNPPTQPSEVVDWGVEMVGSHEVLDGTISEGVRVCILDTGIDSDHPDLLFLEARDFTGSQNGYEDLHSHGTHVAGTVAAIDNEIGVLGASQATLIIGKVLGDTGSGTNAGIAAGINWCVDRGVDIISMSLGGPYPSQVMESALFRASQAGIWVFAAAGNDSSSQVGYPAGYNFPGLFSVSAIDRNRSLAYFSNYGKIEMTCPGVDILSTVPGGQYDRYSGTSMATPICAGVGALYRSLGKEMRFMPNGDPYLFGAGIPDARQVFVE